ncbi:MAG: hypothetical protein CMJ81_22205 [Planctomycetaceae bacterium]|jgi:prepilin-type N-terminal cleavage/methylation domain-containing protein|nr:hypothetical protein [Planctomycetaceae bacterium]MBP63206.1 hypothetical protein [Planctomycetaceae bacterium]
MSTQHARRSVFTARRNAFTLVELLVSILIVSILSGLVLFTMTGAMEVAYREKTRSRIVKLDRVIAGLWNSYFSRRIFFDVDSVIDPAQYPNIEAFTADAKNLRNLRNQRRLDVLRELLRTELPDRKADVEDPPADSSVRSAVAQAYYDFSDSVEREGPAEDGISGWTEKYQGAECLYMIITLNARPGPRGFTILSDDEVGDVDDDGMPEILDAWGMPIEFLRWAPGLVSPKQTRDRSKPDPFDPHNVYAEQQGTFVLYPYIYSAGPDRIYDTRIGLSDVAGMFNYSKTLPRNDPYYKTEDGVQIGEPIDFDDDGKLDNADNIHNHLIGG